jgi:hypothetical protein
LADHALDAHARRAVRAYGVRNKSENVLAEPQQGPGYTLMVFFRTSAIQSHIDIEAIGRGLTQWFGRTLADDAFEWVIGGHPRGLAANRRHRLP